MSKPKLYVGCSRGGRTVFRSNLTPTPKTHGADYFAVIGPFSTLRGAKFMAEHGANNPHVQTVSDAERIARRIGQSKRAT